MTFAKNQKCAHYCTLWWRLVRRNLLFLVILLTSDPVAVVAQDQLAGTENRIVVERQRYNEAVRTYRTDVRRFPSNLFAEMFGFGDREYFEADEAAAEVPEVQF